MIESELYICSFNALSLLLICEVPCTTPKSYCLVQILEFIRSCSPSFFWAHLLLLYKYNGLGAFISLPLFHKSIFGREANNWLVEQLYLSYYLLGGLVLSRMDISFFAPLAVEYVKAMLLLLQWNMCCWTYNFRKIHGCGNTQRPRCKNNQLIGKGISQVFANRWLSRMWSCKGLFSKHYADSCNGFQYCYLGSHSSENSDYYQSE